MRQSKPLQPTGGSSGGFKPSSPLDGSQVQFAAQPNPRLPKEAQGFTADRISQEALSLNDDQWWEALHGAEIEDITQLRQFRIAYSAGVAVLLIGQHIGLWFLIVWALQSHQIKDMSLILSTLVTGTLAESYFVLRLMVNKVFGDIDYHHK